MLMAPQWTYYVKTRVHFRESLETFLRTVISSRPGSSNSPPSKTSDPRPQDANSRIIIIAATLLPNSYNKQHPDDFFNLLDSLFETNWFFPDISSCPAKIEFLLWISQGVSEVFDLFCHRLTSVTRRYLLKN